MNKILQIVFPPTFAKHTLPYKLNKLKLKKKWIACQRFLFETLKLEVNATLRHFNTLSIETRS